MAADLPVPNAEEQARHRTLFASSHYFGIGSVPFVLLGITNATRAAIVALGLSSSIIAWIYPFC